MHLPLILGIWFLIANGKVLALDSASNFSAKIVSGYEESNPEDMLATNIPWQNSKDLIHPPLFQKSFWISIKPQVTPQTAETEDWILSLGNQAAVDWLQFTVMKKGIIDKFSYWGDKIPLSEREYYHPRPALPFKMQKDDDVEILIQFKSPFLGAFFITLQPFSDYMQRTEAPHFISIGYIAIALLMVAYHLFIFYLTRETSYLFYSAMCFGFCLVITSLNGYGYHYIWKNGYWFQDRALSFGVSISAFAVSEFIRSLFSSNRQQSRAWSPYFKAGRWLGLTAFLLTIVLPPLYGMFFAMSVGIIATLFFAVASVANRKTSKSFVIINVGITISVIGAVISSSVLWGLLPKNFYTSQAFIFTNILDLFLFSSALAHHINNIKLEKEVLIRSLSGIVSDNLLSDITQNIDRIPKSTVSANVTVMFVDIVGFSKLFSLWNPNTIINSLKETLDLVAQVVHSFGGTIDRSLGDGILVFFGYDLIGNTRDDHQNVALQAAIKIQEKNFACISAKKNDLILPLRIGINTAECFLGNIGKKGRVDFTIVGDGVNLASRYEAACSPHRIIISESTWSHLNNSYKQLDNFQKIYVKIKHAAALTTAFEYNPFIEESMLKVDHLYWQSRNLAKNSPRYSIERGYLSMSIKQKVHFHILDFSLGGFAAISDQYYSRGVQLMVTFTSSVDTVKNALQENNLTLATVEICWSRLNQGEYYHGCKLIGLHTDKVSEMFQILQETIPHKAKEIA